MSVYYRSNGQSIIVMGKTYQHRSAIKNLGGLFVPDRKVWKLPYSEPSLKELIAYV